VQPYFIVYIKHSLFPSLCIGDNHMTILECHVKLKQVFSSSIDLLCCIGADV